MKKSVLAIIGLVIALVGSNLWWAAQLFDASITHTYTGVTLDDNQEALAQTLALLPVVARPGVTRDEIVAVARGSDDSEPFEKEGFLWVGKIGLRFDEQDRLVEVQRAWSPP